MPSRHRYTVQRVDDVRDHHTDLTAPLRPGGPSARGALTHA